MVIKNKKGWMRILEATVAILIVTSVLLVAYTRQIKKVDPADQILVMQKQVLMDLTSRSDLREYVLEYRASTNDEAKGNLSEYTNSKIPSTYGYCLRVCNMSDSSDRCSITPDCIGRAGDFNDDLFNAIKSSAVYVEETTIASNYTTYLPTKVRLFIWESTSNI